MATPFNQGAPTIPVVLNTSNCFVFGNTASGNALSVQQLGTGNVATFRTTTGATALFVNAAGNVGVGTTNPAASLGVTGNIYASNAVTTTNVFASGNVQIGTGSTAAIGSPSVLFLPTRASSSANAPTVPQTLVRLGWQEGVQDLGVGEGCAVTFASSLIGDAGTYYDAAEIASFKETSADSGRASALTFWTSVDGGVTAPTERMRISSTGSVGIGLTTPEAALDVYSNQATARMARFNNSKNDGGSQDTCFIHTDQPFSTATTAWTGSALTVTTYPNNISTNNGYIAKFGTSDAAGGSMDPKVVISSGYNTLGFVGIGTTSPGVPLVVNGAATFGNPWWIITGAGGDATYNTNTKIWGSSAVNGSFYGSVVYTGGGASSGQWNGSTGVFTFPLTGVYSITIALFVNASAAGRYSLMSISSSVSGSSNQYMNFEQGGIAGTVPLQKNFNLTRYFNANDTFSCYSETGSITLYWALTHTVYFINKIG